MTLYNEVVRFHTFKMTTLNDEVLISLSHHFGTDFYEIDLKQKSYKFMWPGQIVQSLHNLNPNHCAGKQ